MEGESFLSLSINLIDPSLDSLPFKDKKYHDSFLVLKKENICFSCRKFNYIYWLPLLSTISAVVGSLPRTTEMRNLKQHDHCQRKTLAIFLSGLVIFPPFRINAPLKTRELS